MGLQKAKSLTIVGHDDSKTTVRDVEYTHSKDGLFVRDSGSTDGRTYKSHEYLRTEAKS